MRSEKLDELLHLQDLESLLPLDDDIDDTDGSPAHQLPTCDAERLA